MASAPAAGLDRADYVTAPCGTRWPLRYIVHSRARRLRLACDPARGEFRLTVPPRMAPRKALAWADDHRDWAREQAGKLGMNYMAADLTGAPHYNIQLGDAYFARMMSYYGGAYPLAVGAYNAGPGRVNQWLRLNGDPRRGDTDWVTWVEKIPANFETRYYIMRVIGNAVTYSHMYPDEAGLPRPVDSFLR